MLTAQISMIGRGKWRILRWLLHDAASARNPIAWACSHPIARMARAFNREHEATLM
jgi:hypothetical protein